MDPTIQTEAQEAAESAADKMAFEIMAQNARISVVLASAVASLKTIGKPELFQNRYYAWDDVLGLLAELAPTPDAKQAREFAIEQGNQT